MTYDPTSKATGLTRFSLERRITVLVLFLSIIVVGVVATVGIPLELLPRGFEEKSLSVFVPWPDSPTQEVLDKITLPLEEELSTIKGLDGINSYSRTGQSSVYLRFKQGADMDIAYRETRDRVERARILFPEGVDRVFIRKEDISGIPVAVIGLAIDPELTDYYNLVQKEVILPFERVDGVASVNVNGMSEKEIIIEVDRNRAEGAGLNIFQLSQDLGQDNFSMASGNVRDSGKKFLLRSVATYKNLTELENRLVAPNIRLKDIAEVRYEEPDKRYSVRVNSKPAVAIIIQKEGDANTVAVSQRIKAEMERMRENPRLGAVWIEPLFNQGEIVEESISNLVGGGKIGGFFAMLVLFFFLRRFRLTLIITMAIPLSLLIALVAMYFMGETLNLLTILGLMICVGLLVDNSVVVAENIHRLHREGLPRRRACIQGASEIALAITMATLTTVIVFLPVSLIDGQAQFFLLRLSLPISVSLVASLAVALVFVPLCVYITLPMRGAHKETRFRKAHDALNLVLRKAYDASFGRLNHLYTRLLGFFLRRRTDLVLAMAVILALTFTVAFKNIEFVNNQEEDRTSFNINVAMGPEHNFDDIKEFFQKAEKAIETHQRELGLEGYFFFHGMRTGNIQGWLLDDTPNKMSAKQVSEKALELIPKRPGVKLFLGNENEAEDDEGKETFMVRLEGEDAALLEEVGGELEPLFKQVEGVLSIKKGGDESPNELALVVDRDRATASGVNPEFIAGVVSYAIQGSALPRYNDGGREIPVRIRFKEDDRESLTELADFAVPTANGDTLPVSALTSTRMLNTAPRITRRDKKITRTITLDLKESEPDQTRDRIKALMADIDLPEGVSFGVAVKDSSEQEDLVNLALALVLSIFFIYLLMGFLFESFFLPLSIIFTIPLASIGVGWIHFLTGKDLDFLGVVGAVLLVGVVVNNGIVLIDYVNRLRETGIERGQALLLSAERRFRPIVMTALTTIIGMIPLAFSKPSSLGFSYKSFGLTLIGGMSTATILTLLVIPVLYTVFDDMWLVLKRVGGQIIKPRSSNATTVVPTQEPT